MNKENIIDYVLQTPHNPNKKVLDDMLETLIEENGGADNLTYSWNDLTDKPFELTGELVVIADGVTSEPSYDMNADTYTSSIAINKDFVWEDGMVFNILYCDTKYTATVEPYYQQKRISFYDENSWTTIYIYSDGSIEWTSYDLGAFPITITYGEQQVKTIDEIYIPDTIARVSDIPEGTSGSWNELEDRPFGDIVDSGILCEDMSWNGIIKYDISVGKWRKCDELIPDIVNVVNKLNGIENTIVGYENRPGHLAISEDSRVVYGYENNTLRYLIILENNVTTTVESEELTFTNSGFYVNTGVEGTYPVTYNYTQLKTLDEKFIPDTIVRQSALEAYETEIVDRVLSALPTWNGGSY